MSKNAIHIKVKWCWSATGIQTFMTASVFSAYKDILAFVTVKNLNTDYLFKLIRKADYILKELRFSALTLN